MMEDMRVPDGFKIKVDTLNSKHKFNTDSTIDSWPDHEPKHQSRTTSVPLISSKEYGEHEGS